MASALALALALTAPQPAVSLEALFAFSDPARCVPAPLFGDLLDRLWTTALGDHAWENSQAVIKPYAGLFDGPVGLVYGNNDRVIVHAATRGMWHGARLTGFHLTALPGEKRRTLSLVFKGSEPAIRNMLSGQGFRWGVADNGVEIALRDGEAGFTVLTCTPHG